MSIEAAPVTRVIRVSQTRNDIKVRSIRRTLSVNSVGRRGPVGGNGIVNHAGDADYPRPVSSDPIIWLGSVEPLQALDYELWVTVV